MTEAEWLAANYPYPMLKFLHAWACDRKIRLFGCACVRRVWHLNRDERLGPILLAVEDFADGLITADEMRPLHLLAADIGDGDDDQSPDPDGPSGSIACELMYASVVPLGHPFSYHGPSHRVGHSAAAAAASVASQGAGLEEFWRMKDVEFERQTVLVRDIFGNPFRPVTINPDWLTSTAIALARGMYESRDFSPMPILADALQDAGCDNDDILTHCRGPGPHVRGCWVVDLVLGKG
jgi:hypothetical protein